ncbi:hypothetical protein MASR1M12_02960 [Erysipelotrichia bacterium]
MTVGVEVATESEVATEAEHVFDLQVSKINSVVSVAAKQGTNTRVTESAAISGLNTVYIVKVLGEH